jgi:hypothetical protein
MRIDNTVLLLLPMVFVALGAAVRDGAHQDSMVLKILLSVAALTIAVTCLVRGIARIRAEGSGGVLAWSRGGSLSSAAAGHAQSGERSGLRKVRQSPRAPVNFVRCRIATAPCPL